MSSLPPPVPVMLDLAPLPRSQVGPFLILGVDKDADREALEANWAQRLIWARKNLIKVPLEDINWARELINDPEARVRADAMSLNVATTDGVPLHPREGLQGKARLALGCGLLDVEKNLADYEPPLILPDLQEVRRQIPAPQISRDVPAVQLILAEMVSQPIDAWQINLD